MGCSMFGVFLLFSAPVLAGDGTITLGQAQRPYLTEERISLIQEAGRAMYGVSEWDGIAARKDGRAARLAAETKALMAKQAATRTEIDQALASNRLEAGSRGRAAALVAALSAPMSPPASKSARAWLEALAQAASPLATGPQLDLNDANALDQQVEAWRRLVAVLDGLAADPPEPQPGIDPGKVVELLTIARAQLAQAERLRAAQSALARVQRLDEERATAYSRPTVVTSCREASEILDAYFGSARVRQVPDLVVYQARGMPGPAVCLVARKAGPRTVLAGERELFVLYFSEIRLAADPGAKDAVDAQVQLGGLRVAESLGQVPSGLISSVSVPGSVMNEVAAQLGDPKSVSFKPLHAEGSSVELYYGHAAFALEQGSLNRVRISDARRGEPTTYFTFANTRGHYFSFSVGAGWAMFRQGWSLDPGQAGGVDECCEVVEAREPSVSQSGGGAFDRKFVVDDVQFYAHLWIHPFRRVVRHARDWDTEELVQNFGVGVGMPVNSALLSDPLQSVYFGLRAPIPQHNRPWSHWGLTMGFVAGPRFNDIRTLRADVEANGYDPDELEDLNARIVWQRLVLGMDYQF